MRECGISVTVKDGNEKIKKISDFVLSKNGGCGAIRELVELILGEYCE
jgi:3-deoxy-D-manno-octulosonate 8-phosphate phosphatase KdsC-like HAD superfamily phosphatase